MPHKTDILQELHDLGLNIPDHSFTSDKDLATYFDNFSTSLMERIETESFIETLPRTMPFDIPKDYLNTFEVRSIVTPPTYLRSNYVRIGAIAASIILVIGLSWIFTHRQNTTSTTPVVASQTQPHTPVPSTTTKSPIATISQLEATEFVKNNIEEYDIEQLADNSVAQNISLSPTLQNKNSIEPTTEEIKEYLEEESIEDIL